QWDGPWAPGETITGTATLTLSAGAELHTNLASVDAVGAASGTPVEDDDPYNATPPEAVEETPPPADGETPPPADGEEPTPDASDDPSDPETPKDKDGELSSTGANFALIFGALGLLLLLTGGLLYARHRNSNEV
ncbi:MAG TPA: LPXTG cell wall anchor domain-containing protein, partial [Yaniella sp.]